MTNVASTRPWPSLGGSNWPETCEALQDVARSMGRLRLSRGRPGAPPEHAPLYVTGAGLTTSLIPDARTPFTVELDAVDERVTVGLVDGRSAHILLPQISDLTTFESDLHEALLELGVEETGRRLTPARAFSPAAHHHRSVAYDGECARRLMEVLTRLEEALRAFQRVSGTPLGRHCFHWHDFRLIYADPITMPSRAAAQAGGERGEWAAAGVFTVKYSPGVGTHGGTLTAGFASSRAAWRPRYLPYVMLEAATCPDVTLRRFLGSALASRRPRD